MKINEKLNNKNLVQLFHLDNVSYKNGEQIKFSDSLIIGNKLSVNGNYIVVGSGISKVKIWHKETVRYTAPSGNSNCYYGAQVYINDTSASPLGQSREYKVYGNPINANCTPQIYEVNEGDTITLKTDMGQNADFNNVYLNVETI